MYSTIKMAVFISSDVLYPKDRFCVMSKQYRKTESVKNVILTIAVCDLALGKIQGDSHAFNIIIA